MVVPQALHGASGMGARLYLGSCHMDSCLVGMPVISVSLVSAETLLEATEVEEMKAVARVALRVMAANRHFF
jgi:hypothetical protein